MIVRGLPLLAGIAPLAAITFAHWLGVSYDVLPSCIPYLEGCTSVSATGRYEPSSFLFRAIMLPQSVILLFVWYFATRWLSTIGPSKITTFLILFWGVVGAVALVLYVTFLGTKAPFYEFMRRFGIYLYFLGTALAQLFLALALLRHAKVLEVPSLRRWAMWLLTFCGLPFVLGIVNLILKAIIEDPDVIENIIEWNAALLMQAYFVVLYFVWRNTGFAFGLVSIYSVKGLANLSSDDTEESLSESRNAITSWRSEITSSNPPTNPDLKGLRRPSPAKAPSSSKRPPRS